MAARVLDQLRDIRAITDRNVRGVKDTQEGTADLLKHAEALAASAHGARAATRRHERAMTNGNGRG